MLYICIVYLAYLQFLQSFLIIYSVFFTNIRTVQQRTILVMNVNENNYVLRHAILHIALVFIFKIWMHVTGKKIQLQLTL